MPHENDDQYIWRIGELKSAGLTDLSWEELAAILNSQLDVDYDSSVYRKRYRDFLRAYENIFSKLESEEYFQELTIKKRELEKIKKQIQTEKIEYNQWLRQEARDELLVEKIRDEIREFNKSHPLAKANPINRSNAECGNVNNGTSWVLAFGDAHFGAEVNIKGLHGETLNKYNPEIFYERMDDLFCQVVSIILDRDIHTLYVFDLGDAIDGILRVSQLMKLRYGVVESTLKYANYLADWLNNLSEFCKIRFRMCNGNHSEIRHLGQKKGAFEKDNMGSIIYEFLKIRLSDNPNINIESNETGMIFECIEGFNILGYHGESKKLEDTMSDFSRIYKTHIDILLAGHLHHSYSETVGVNSDVMRTPSIIGIDDFSLSLSKTSNAGATLFSIEQDKGKTIEYHIKLNEIEF